MVCCRSAQTLSPPICFTNLIDKALKRVKPHLKRVLEQGAETLAATIDVLLGMVPGTS